MKMHTGNDQHIGSAKHTGDKHKVTHTSNEQHTDKI